VGARHGGRRKLVSDLEGVFTKEREGKNPGVCGKRRELPGEHLPPSLLNNTKLGEGKGKKLCGGEAP